ncbi:MAG: hypothetical protein ACPG4T_13305 [Nannocystaceae bacterium]
MSAPSSWLTPRNPSSSEVLQVEDGLMVDSIAENIDNDDWWVRFEDDCIEDTNYLDSPTLS